MIKVLAIATILLSPTLSVATDRASDAAHRPEVAPGPPAPSATPGGYGVIGGPVGPAEDRPVLGDQNLGLVGPAPLSHPSDADLVPYSGQSMDALPLSRFAGANATASVEKDRFDIWDLITRVRSGGLPEPASWALMLIGFGMIGAALRGFVVANRRLARLQPEDSDQPADP